MKTSNPDLKGTGKSTNLRIFGLLILCVFFIRLYEGSSEERPTSPQFDAIDGVDDVISLSATYLVKITKEDGMFEYRINMDPTIKVKDKYNILRHAGALYAMCMYYERHPDENMRSAIERSGKYLRDKSILPIPGKENMLAVWSEPEVNRSGKPLQIKLGGTGLGLVALLSIEKIFPRFTPLPDLQALGRSIVYMQKDDGSFYSKYVPSEGGNQDDWQSLYYPGEASLGLLMLYEKDPSSIWLKSAYQALEYLAQSRKNSADIPADHWALLAIAKILSLEKNNEVPISESLLVNHAIHICETMIREQIDDPARPDYDGGFAEDGRTTPTATRLEGLLAASSFLPVNHEMRKRIDASIPRGISFLIRAQIKEGEFTGAMPRAVGGKWGNNPDIKKFNRRVTEVRIDYIQHAMCAMMQYQQLKK
jgi:hypothetical protein